MRLIPFLLVGTMVFCRVTPANGQQGRPTVKEATTAQVVEPMTLQKAKDPVSLHFELEMGGKVLGYGIASLTPADRNGNGGYRYRFESAIILPNGQRMEAEASARLTDTFEPLEVEFRREVTSPDGKRLSTVERAELGDTEVLLTREADADPPARRSVPKPESPFVFGVEFFVQRVDLKRFPVFVIREFDFQKGSIVAQHFKIESDSRGIRRLVSGEDDGSVGYVFEIDAKGELVSWSEPPLPVVSKTCSRERYEELRKSIGR
jgi:hypothetical protein